MKEMVDKLVAIEKSTSLEKGEYDLFALFLREDASNKWDILVSASWISQNKGEALGYLAKKIQDSLTTGELLLLSRIVIIEGNNPSLPAIQKLIHVEHGTAEVKESTFFGLQIKHAFLITSKKHQAA